MGTRFSSARNGELAKLHHAGSLEFARNFDYMIFSTRVGVSDDVTDVTKHN